MLGLATWMLHGGGLAGFAAPVALNGVSRPSPLPHARKLVLVLKTFVCGSQLTRLPLGALRFPAFILPALGSKAPFAR